MKEPLLWERRKVNQDTLVDALCFVLRGNGWMKSKAIEAKLGLTDRGVRRIKQLSRGRVISGQKGYALAREAAVEDVIHYANAMRSQARAMELEAFQAEREMHQREAV